MGAIGFLIDTGILLLLVNYNCNPYIARLVSFTIAATFTWGLNRSFTFNTQRKPTSLEWHHYLAIMAVGAFINNAAYAVTIFLIGHGTWQYVTGIMLGAILSLLFNFTGGKRLYTQQNNLT